MREYFQVVNVGASRNEIEELQRQLGHELPAAYLALLCETNGAEWGVHDTGGDCLQFWKTHEVPVLNVAYEVQRWLPDVVAIASDGGERAIILDFTEVKSPNECPVFLVPLGALDRDEFRCIAANFLDWVQQEFRLPDSK